MQSDALLLRLEAIAERLDQQFVPLGPEFDNFRLKASRDGKEELKDAQRRLVFDFPPSFSQLVEQYDLGDFRVGGVWFGHGEGNFTRFLVRENSEPEGWWDSAGKRPTSLIQVAASDGYLFLLESETGNISAFRRAQDWHSHFVVAADFERFLRGAATQFLEREKLRRGGELINDLRAEVGAAPNDPFWAELVTGVT